MAEEKEKKEKETQEKKAEKLSDLAKGTLAADVKRRKVTPFPKHLE